MASVTGLLPRGRYVVFGRRARPAVGLGRARVAGEGCYFKPNCAFWMTLPFWNITFMLLPQPSPSHLYMTVL